MLKNWHIEKIDHVYSIKMGTSLLSYIVRFFPSTTHLVSLTLDFTLVRFCAKKPVTWWDAPLSKYQFWLALIQLSNCARQQRLWLLHRQNILHYHCFFSTKFVGFSFSFELASSFWPRQSLATWPFLPQTNKTCDGSLGLMFQHFCKQGIPFSASSICPSCSPSSIVLAMLILHNECFFIFKLPVPPLHTMVLSDQLGACPLQDGITSIVDRYWITSS